MAKLLNLQFWFEQLQNPEFWVGLAFCLVVLFAIAPIRKKATVWGARQAKAVQDELDSAAQLREQAEALYTEYEAHTKTMEQERAEILRSAEKEVITIQQEADEQMAQRLAFRKKEVQEKIQAIQSTATHDVSKMLLTQVVQKTKELLTENPVRQTQADMDAALDQVLHVLEKTHVAK